MRGRGTHAPRRSPSARWQKATGMRLGLTDGVLGCEIDDAMAETILPEVPVECQERVESLRINQGE